MKQFYTFMACGLALLLAAPFAEAGQLSLQIMTPEGVKLTMQSWENPAGEIITPNMGVNTIQYDESKGGQLVIEGVAPYQLTAVYALGNYESPMVTFNRAAITLTSETNGHFYNVNVINLDEARTASVTFSIADENFVSSLLKVRRGDNEIEITENPQIVVFNPETESQFNLQRSDWKPICDVKKNGKVVLPRFGMYSFGVADGDNLSITLDYPDIDLPVVINYPEGLKEVIKGVSINGTPATNWDSADFKVHSGMTVQVDLDNMDYKILGVDVNGVAQENVYNNVFFTPGLEPVTIDVKARKYGNYSVTLNIDHPDRLEIYPGQWAGTDNAFELTGNTTVVEVPELDPYICMTVDPNYVVTSVTDGEGNTLPFLNAQSKSILVEEGMVVNIETAEKAFDSSFVIYLDTEENVTSRRYVCRGEMVYTQIHEGYNIVRFIGAEQPQYLLQFYANTEGNFYVNGEKQDVYNPMSYYWQGIPEDGMVIKVYFGGEPSEHQVSVEVDESIADKIKVVTDMITPVEEYSNLSLHKGSHIGLSMSEGVNANVSVDGEALTPDDNGMHNIFVSGDHRITVKAGEVPSGIGEIESGSISGTIYNLQGIRVALDADAATVKNLPSGIYIISGKKVTVK